MQIFDDISYFQNEFYIILFSSQIMNFIFAYQTNISFQEKRNFLRSPPPGANYHFDMTAVYPVALATLEVDENLKQMRFDLVPKQ